jgi:hypothetical protein
MVALKSGVLFASMPSGGTLLDIAADRYIALSPLSALIWRDLSAGASQDNLVAEIMRAGGTDEPRARLLLDRQLQLWKKAQLVEETAKPAAILPRSKPSVDAVRGLEERDVARASIRLSLVAEIWLVERTYRKSLQLQGLAKTLVRLQAERGKPDRSSMPAIAEIVRAYHAVRRPFRQGRTASDCLVRSLALAALLRRHGLMADVCIGIIDMPFSAHAWVEADGAVLNEELTKRQGYTVIGRF